MAITNLQRKFDKLLFLSYLLGWETLVVNIKEEHIVEFFQMEIDEKHFGKLKAVKIENI